MPEPIFAEDAQDINIGFFRCRRSLAESKVPVQLHDGLARYLAGGVPPGSFLTAVLSNDAATAIRRADDTCRAGYGELVLWLAQYAPADAWGSDENFTAWRASFAEKCVRCEKQTTDLSFDGLCEPCAEQP